MNTTSNKAMQRSIGVALLTGAAAAVIGLAGAGSAAATPATPDIPRIPGGPVLVGPVNPGDAVSLNPQPLPPRMERLGPWVDLNPQPLPPAPPDPGPDFSVMQLGF